MKVINKNGTDKTVIMAIREGLVQPFQADNWLDLRVGFLLSITDDTTDDDPTLDLTETIGSPVATQPSDRYWIGVKTRGSNFPFFTGVVFAGFTNSGSFSDRGSSQIVTSDAAIGTTNAYFWRVRNADAANPQHTFRIYDGVATRGVGEDGMQQHFAKDVTNAGGYATLLLMRLQRANSISKVLTVTVKKGTHNGDVAYTNTPTAAYLISQMESFPSVVQQFGPSSVSSMPDSIFIYWPFRNSRLRMHAMGVLQAS